MPAGRRGQRLPPPASSGSYYDACREVCERIWSKIPELPFSQLYVAAQLFDKLPANSTVHLGILSPLRSWGYFPMAPSIEIYCNQGGFGIDGNLSTLLGASLAQPDKLFFGMVGDLSFFYDMNVLGNRHVGKNIRILLINNNVGAEFLLFRQIINSTSIDDIESYIAAKGHFGQKSPWLVKHYAEDLGYEYLSAANKEEFETAYARFLVPEITDKPMIFEIFTDSQDENDALYRMWHIETSTTGLIREQAKKIIRDDDLVNRLKNNPLLNKLMK